MIWTDQNCDLLRSRWAEGYSASQIAAEVGTTRNAVIGKAHRLGLPGRVEKKRTDKPERRSKIKPVFFCEQLPLPVPLPFDGNPITMMDLNNITCRWPVNEDVRNMLYCGRPEASIDHHQPYCYEHAKISRGERS